MTKNRSISMVGRVDWLSILIYTALVLIGWMNIYAAVYDEAYASIFDMSQRYGMQFIWISICLFIGVAVLLIDDKYYHMFAYLLYFLMIIVLIVVLFIGKEVNGAKAWISIGPVALQPTELAKFTTALALARFVSTYNFSITKFKSLLGAIGIIALPVSIIFLQNDTGSAVVYGAFLIPLFREGLNRWVYIALFAIIGVFVLEFLLTPLAMLIAIILLCVIGEGLTNGKWKEKIIYLAAIALISLILYFIFNFVFVREVGTYITTMISVVLSLGLVTAYSWRHKLGNVWLYVGLFVGLVAFYYAVSYVFNDVMQLHQQKRVMILLGLEDDPRGWGYNVNQSKIAIGSGGLLGKGFLNGTQTKFDFVPEQSTDFIFCTVGEEWGFVGTITVLLLFVLLILRLIKMGERQQEAFGRFYCYSAAAIFFAHVLINIGMTIGIMPVIGIPLPFFSYGGSSLITFTILFFVAVKLDSTRRNNANEGALYDTM